MRNDTYLVRSKDLKFHMPKNGGFSYNWLDDGAIAGVVGPTAALKTNELKSSF